MSDNNFWDNARPIKQTEVMTTNLEEVTPGLRIIDKFHPPSAMFPNASHEQVFGVKGQQIDTKILDNTTIDQSSI